MPNNVDFYGQLITRFPADLSTSCLITGQIADYSWLEVHHASAKLANLLHNLTLPVNTSIAVQLDHSPEALILYLAVLRAGMTLLPLPMSYQREEMRPVIHATAPAVVVCSPGNFGWLAQLAFQSGCSHVFTLNSTFPNQGSLLQRAAPLDTEFNRATPKSTDVAYISIQTSDTGIAQVAHSHNELCTDFARTLTTFQEWTGYTPEYGLDL